MIHPKAQFVIENTHSWQLRGELSFDTVSALLANIIQQSTPPQVLDLHAVTRIDSAGLALLIELRKQFNTLIFKNIPPQIHTLAKVSEVENLLL
jgi:phospholipid transport system transporter-binding protein